MQTVDKVILFNDIVKSSMLWKKYKHLMFEKLLELNKIIHKLSKKHNGFIVKIIGDSYFMTFDNIENAILFNIDLIMLLNDKPLKFNKNDKIILRSGLCFGNVNEYKYMIQNCKFVDYFGNVVNSASRMESKVSKTNGFAIGLIKYNTDDINNIMDILEEYKQFGTKFSLYTDKCKKIAKKTLKKRHNMNCKTISKLRGIDNIYTISVFLKK